MQIKTLAVCALLTSMAWAQPAQEEANYQPASGKWAHRGGTVVQQIDAQTYTVTTNGPMPYRGILSASRGAQVLDGAYVLESGNSIVRIQAWSRNSLKVGDLVMLDSVLAPKKVEVSAPTYAGHHPTSANADPTYREWLSRGFTTGGITSQWDNSFNTWGNSCSVNNGNYNSNW